MNWRHYVRSHLSPLHVSSEREIEIVEELAAQLEAIYSRARSAGASHREAIDRAEAEVPNWQDLARTLDRIERRHVPSPTVGASTGGLMTGFIQDIRYALRALARAPGFSAVAVLTLALGIGATTIVYSLVDGILLKPLPIRDPDRVVLARELSTDKTEMSISWPNFQDWVARTKSFESLGAWRGVPANLTGLGQPRRIQVRQVTANLFDILGVRPVAGRGLTAADDQWGVERVCLVSFGFWQRELGGDPSAVGRRITLDEVPVTIVGVLPRDFTVARQEDAFLPFGNFLRPGSFMFGRGNHFGLAAIGRLAPGITLEMARAEIETLAQQLALEHPETNTGNGGTARLLFDVLVDDARSMLWILLGSVVAMLLIACVNLANLLLARAAGRSQEMAVRRSLGAAGWRVMRQMLTESVLLGLLGGVAGVALAWFGFDAIVALLPADQPRIHIVALDGRVLLVSALLSIATGVLFGLAPALHAIGGRALGLLQSARVSGAGQTRQGTRRALLVTEVALATVLLAGAGLMLRTMNNLFAVETGIDHASVTAAQVLLPQRYDMDRRRMFVEQTVERIKAIPGVVNAAFTYSLPVQGSTWSSIFIVGDQPIPARADLPNASWTPVSVGYFETMGIRLLRGRFFEAADGPQASTVAVINESFARRFWPDGDPIGQRIKQGWPEDDEPWREIVGVVRDVKTSRVDQPSAFEAFLPHAQIPQNAGNFVARTTGSPSAIASALEAAIHEVDPNLPVNVRTMERVVEISVGNRRLTTVMLGGFALLAVLMAAIGVFGVTAYSVSQRTQEVSIRMALGANRGAVLALVLRQELAACIAGIAVGLGGALSMSSLLSALLFGIAPRDPATIGMVATLLLLVTFIACYLPARRATRVDPVQALRSQ
ncbi:MAG: ABC transporter permease [Vicinamibacterales bacterium]